MIKLAVKQTAVTQAKFHERLLCFRFPHCRTTEKLFKNFRYDGKKRFTFCICGRPRNQKNTLFPPKKNPSVTICKTAQKSVVTKMLRHAVKLMLEKYLKH